MKKVAAYFGKNVLREVDEESFYEAVPKLRNPKHQSRMHPNRRPRHITARTKWRWVLCRKEKQSVS